MAELDTFLRFEDVSMITGLGRSAIYALIRENRFPKPIPITTRRVGWSARELQEWQEERAVARDAGHKVVVGRGKAA